MTRWMARALRRHAVSLRHTASIIRLSSILSHARNIASTSAADIGGFIRFAIGTTSHHVSDVLDAVVAEIHDCLTAAALQSDSMQSPACLAALAVYRLLLYSGPHCKIPPTLIQASVSRRPLGGRLDVSKPTVCRCLAARCRCGISCATCLCRKMDTGRRQCRYLQVHAGLALHDGA